MNMQQLSLLVKNPLSSTYLGADCRETEKCSVVDDSVDCLYQIAPELDDYYFYPELFLVSDDFCKK